jgi:sugar phosphate isomerase/epimerase
MPKNQLNLFVSLWNYLYYDDPKSLDMILGEIALNGFGVEFWPAIYSSAPYRPAYHQSHPKAGALEMDDLFKEKHRAWLRSDLDGMRSCWHSRAFVDEPKLYATFEAYKEEIDTAAYLGSEAISVHYIGKDLTTQSFTGDNLDFVQNVLDYAESRDVQIALETYDFISLRDAVNQFENLGVCLDPACIHGVSEYSLKDFIEVTMDRICFLHLYDSREDEGHLTPGTGDIPRDDWLYMLEVLREIDFQGPAVLEIRPPKEKASQTPIEAAIEAREFFEGLG